MLAEDGKTSALTFEQNFLWFYNTVLVEKPSVKRTRICIMKSNRVQVGTKHGVHMRIAGVIVQAASRFRSSIFVSKGGVKTNCKSILGLISLTVHHGEVLTIEAEGDDEHAAITEISSLLAKDLSDLGAPG